MKVSVLTWCPWEAGHVIKVKKTPLFEHKTKKIKRTKASSNETSLNITKPSLRGVNLLKLSNRSFI